ncbi:MAG TPA: HAD-IA family hydrolase [Microthrixaceae bacterium]|nr:HAD-IA family hydrolase [Microthrixaceae bacterium]
MSDASLPTLRAVVFDLDGVIRHWNDDELDAVEAACGLPPRTILDIAFDDELGPGAMTGRLTYREWMDEIRRRVLSTHGSTASDALDAWECNVGLVDPDAVALVRRVRSWFAVALLSNGTTRLRRDLHVLGIDDEFDQVFNTAELGVAKPAAEVYGIVCERLGLDAGEVAFVDDLEVNVHGARDAGLHATVHLDLTTTTAFLEGLGLPAGSGERRPPASTR